MAKMKAKSFKIMAYTIAGVLVALLLVLSIAVGVFSTALDIFVVGYKTGEGSSAARAAGGALAEQIQAEGTVLVKNEQEDKSALLPMSVAAIQKDGNPQVNVFGWGSVDWVISGSGSGQVKRGGSVDFLGALTEAGISYNTALTNMYKSYRPNREFSINGSHAGGEKAGNPGGSGSLHSFNYQFSRLYEPSITDTTRYTQDILDGAKAYSDTAFVVIGRVSGESNDSPKVQYKGQPGTSSSTAMPTESNIDRNRTYLEISTEEEALLEYVGANYKNVIVLINSTNVMELGFVENIRGIDACLVVATTGSAGARAIPYIVFNDLEKADKNGNKVPYSINPSGKLADTYAYDLSTSSTYVDTGSGNDTTHFYTNGSGLYPTNVQHTNGSSNVPYEGVAYQDYREGIYMGYKWYETADAEGFWTSSYAKSKWSVNGYDDVVQYPFGYGLSYSQFTWKVSTLEHAPNATLTGNDIIKIGITVKNIGSVAGQDVVELYYSAPYKTGGIEKSSVNLGAFGKTTKVLQPEEEEQLYLEMKVSDMASYDYEGKKISGGGYILEEGAYTLTLRTDAHTVADNNKMASGLAGATITYRIARDTQVNEEAVNRFTGDNTTDGVAIDGNSDGSAEITYLSRNDFTGTFPGEATENRAMTAEIRALNLYTAEMANAYRDAHSDAEAVAWGSVAADRNLLGSTVTEGNNTYFKLNDYGMELGLDYNHDGWNDVLDHVTKTEAQNLVLHGYTKTEAVNSIGKPPTQDKDGPNQANSFSDTNADKANPTGYSSIVLAQTWNLNLAYSMGLSFANECIDNSMQGWYGPGVNPHRSPFGGRNYEYYSEDAYLSGMMCARVVEAAKNKGVFCYLKHICLYEGESGRDGMYTWLTEQSLREVYLKPFELAVKEGGSSAIMTSYGRIGAVWTGGSEALLTEVVRGEWGFEGAFLTDYADHHDFMNGAQMIRAGGDLWMDGWNNNGAFTFDTTSNAFDQALRSAAKNVIYMWLNAMATNQDYNAKIEAGLIQDTITIPSIPEYNFRWYIPVVIVIDLLFAAGAGVLIFFAIKRKKDPAEAATVTAAATAGGNDEGDIDGVEQSATETVTCPNCGEQLPAGAKFCGKCGNTLNKE